MNFDEKIKQLLEEGRRLGSVESEPPAVRIDTRPSGARKLSYDVSKLKNEIEEQNRKTQELKQEIQQATESFRANAPKQRPSFLSNMNANNSNNLVLPGSFPGAYGDFAARPKTSSVEHLEKALDDAQAQVKYLTKKLEESHETAEKQKVHFRTAVEELQMKLQETVAGRKHLVQLRETEMEEQENMIHKLQTTLKELAAANQMQEQSLHDATDRIELLEKRNQDADKAFERIRNIFSSHEKIKGKPYRVPDSSRLSDISPDFLADNVERTMNEMYEEIETMRNKILELENEICDIKQDHEREVDMLSVKQQEAAEQLRIETNERVLEEKLNTDSAMKQVYSLQDELQQQKYTISSKEQEIRDIEKELTIITTQFEELKNHYFDDKESLQTKLLNSEEELSTMKQTNETNKHECERLKQQLADSQSNFLRTNEELKSEREQRRNLWIKETESSKEINELRQQLEVKAAEVATAKEKNSEQKAEHSTQLADKVREAELVERSKADRKVSELNEEMTRLREDLSRTKATLESTERQISDVTMERSDTVKMLQEKDLQFERITNQCNIAERKLAEATEAKKNTEEKWEKLYQEYSEIVQKSRKNQADCDTMKSTLDEKERQIVTLQLRYEAVTSEAEKAGKDLNEVKVERSKLNLEIKQKSKELEELRGQKLINEKTISDYEGRIGELIQDKNKFSAESRKNEEENTDLKHTLEKVEEELVEARNQIEMILNEKDEIKKQKGEVENRGRSENEKLKKQLKQVKRNLKDAEKSLMTIKSVDGRAAKIAENMQKEVTSKRSLIDSLKSELSKTIDRLSAFEKENKNLKSEYEDVESRLEESDCMRNKMEQELKELKKTEKGYRLAVERLEKGLEMAAVRNSEAQSTIAQQENDIAQLHIQHNMNMMNKRGQLQSVPDRPGNTLYQPSIAQPSTNVAQSMLARLILNMTSQQQTPLLETLGQQASGMAVMKKEDIAGGKAADGAQNVAQADMVKLLSDVRDHLVKMDKPVAASTKKRSPSKKKLKKPIPMVESIGEFDSESSELPVVTMTSGLTSPFSGSMMDSITMGSTLKDTLTTSPLKQDRRSGASDRPPSPVSELLGQDDTHLRKRLFPRGSPGRKSPKKVLQDNTDSNSGMTSDTTADIPATNTAALKTAITTTAEDLCRQLQDRLEGLSKMGGKLKQQNKMTERMIKKQDEKLQKVRGGLKFR